MRIFLYILPLIFCHTVSLAQNYTVFHTGSDKDTITQPQGGICMMGGSSEDDNAMRWSLNRAAGGDILVLRTSGSNGYNNYMYSQLGVKVNSVETIVCNNAKASDELYVQQKVATAEAIWFAGGDQGEYVKYWRGTKIDSLINDGILNRNIVVGGTSAGMAIMGKFIYTGRNGSVTSEQALANPYHSRVTIDSARFLDNHFLEDVITDTHYDDPDRRGRHVTFMARIMTDFQVAAKGIACDEYTAVCIDKDGIARVFGEYPKSNDNAYFLRPNCGLTDFSPELCAKNQPLSWSHMDRAIWVYKVKGTKEGNNTFDLKDWITGDGGTWEYWYVNQGSLGMKATDQADCLLLHRNNQSFASLEISPNPASDMLKVDLHGEILKDVKLLSPAGKVIEIPTSSFDQSLFNVSQLPAGTYILVLTTDNRTFIGKFIKQ